MSLEGFERAFAELDFVLLGVASASALNERAPPAARLPIRTENASAVLLGTTRTFWPRFLRERNSRSANPLDELVERLTHETLTRLYGSDGYSVVFSHVLSPAPYPFQRLAEEFGLPVGRHGLSLHPEFGSWFALRAVATVPTLGPLAPVGPGFPGTGTPCAGCAAPCRRVRPSTTVRGLPSELRVALAAREACPVGAEKAYGAAQIGYHYTKNSQYLTMSAASE